MRSIPYCYRHKIPLAQRGVGRCKVGDKYMHKGVVWTVVEVIPYGMYPTVRPNLKVRGYYREHESYIVENSKGKQRWPVVGHLLKMKKVQ